jgi:DNA topoisomerase IA
VDGAPPPLPGFPDHDAAEAVAARVGEARFAVSQVTRKEQQRQPPPPFTTSTLQQEANKRLGMGETLAFACLRVPAFLPACLCLPCNQSCATTLSNLWWCACMCAGAGQTMQLAQQLYESGE